MPNSLLLLAAMSPGEWILLVGAIAVFAVIAQRDYQRYKLQKAAIEKGLSLLPTGAPLWLASLKTGFLVLALGAGLITMGGIGLATLPDPKNMLRQPAPNSATAPAGTNPSTEKAAAQLPPPQNENFPPPFPGGPGMGGPGGMGPNGRPLPGGPGFGPGGRPLPGDDPLRLGNPPRPEMSGDRGGPQQPEPRPDPRRDAEDGRRICYWAIGAGGVISLLGLVLTLFSMLERKYVTPLSGDQNKK